jgi:hypothetical protein
MIGRRTGAPAILAAASTVGPATSDVWVVRPGGVGLARIDMSRSELSYSLHEKFLLPGDVDELTDAF